MPSETARTRKTGPPHGEAALFAEERQLAILRRLEAAGKVTVEELAAAFGVSTPTVRSDLSRLEERGLLRRTHGGAIGASSTLFEPPFSQREVMHRPEKRAIAALAATLVQEGDTILLDAGTTTCELALRLRPFRSLTVVTNSLENASVLMDSPGVQVILVGGLIQPRRRAALGPLAMRFLEPFHVDRAFLAFNGVDAEAGFTVVDFDAADVKRQMMARASEVVVLADSSKIGKTAFAAVAPLAAAHFLITDPGIAPEDRRRLQDAGLVVRVASAKA